MSADSAIRAFLQGRALKEQKEQRQFELEDRADRRKLMQLRIKQEEMQDKLAARREATENAALMEGQKGRNPIEAGVEGQLPATPSSPIIPLQHQQVPHKPIQIPAAHGSEGISVQPRTEAEVDQRTMDALMQKLFIKKQERDFEHQFAAGETEKKNIFTAEQNQLNRDAANQRSAETNATRLKTAGIRASGSRGSGKGGGSSIPGLKEAILENPEIYDRITATERGKVTPELHAAGFTAFGKPLSDKAVKEITQSESAISELNDLQGLIEKNKEFIGPVAGLLTTVNPYSKGRQVAADIARVRQRVGKALEGGVLRKEDEIKYKTILADITDTDVNAQYKIKSLINDIERDVAGYKRNQKLGGRRVDGQTNQPSGGGYSDAGKEARYQEWKKQQLGGR